MTLPVVTSAQTISNATDPALSRIVFVLSDGTQLEGTAILGAVNPAAGAAVNLATSAPTVLVANTEAIIPFVVPVTHVILQNNSAYAINIEFDATVSAGSFLIPANSSPIAFDLTCSVVHALCTNAVNINGTSAGNLVIRGRL